MRHLFFYIKTFFQKQLVVQKSLYNVAKFCWIFFVTFGYGFTKIRQKWKIIKNRFLVNRNQKWQNFEKIFLMIFPARVQNIWRASTLTLVFGDYKKNVKKKRFFFKSLLKTKPKWQKKVAIFFYYFFSKIKKMSVRVRARAKYFARELEISSNLFFQNFVTFGYGLTKMGFCYVRDFCHILVKP